MPAAKHSSALEMFLRRNPAAGFRQSREALIIRDWRTQPKSETIADRVAGRCVSLKTVPVQLDSARAACAWFTGGTPVPLLELSQHSQNPRIVRPNSFGIR